MRKELKKFIVEQDGASTIEIMVVMAFVVLMGLGTVSMLADPATSLAENLSSQVKQN